MLEGAYSNVQENRGQWKRDLDQGMTRARDEASDMKDDYSDDGDTRQNRRVAQTMSGRYAVSETPPTDLER